MSPHLLSSSTDTPEEPTETSELVGVRDRAFVAAATKTFAAGATALAGYELKDMDGWTTATSATAGEGPFVGLYTMSITSTSHSTQSCVTVRCGLPCETVFPYGFTIPLARRKVPSFVRSLTRRSPSRMGCHSTQLPRLSGVCLGGSGSRTTFRPKAPSRNLLSDVARYLLKRQLLRRMTSVRASTTSTSHLASRDAPFLC